MIQKKDNCEKVYSGGRIWYWWDLCTVARYDSLGLLIALAVCNSWHLEQMDVKLVFFIVW